MNPELKKVLEQKWYTQGFAGRPFFLVTVASIDLMHRGLGFSYNAIPFLYKKDYCEANYAKKDLKEHAEIILQKLEKNPEYLKEKRNQYNQEVAVFEEEYKTAETRTKKSDEKELFELSYRFGNSIESMAGIAHFHESISLRLEHEIRHLLMEKVKGKQLNEAFSTLTTPTAQSFLGKKEEALWIIKNAPQEKKEALAQEFIKNFFWVKSGYTGSHALTIIEVLDEADRLERFLKPDFEKIKKQKEQLFQQYDFTEKGIQWIQWSEFLTDWQDERKKNIFRAIFYADQALHEISKRYTIEVKYLHYLLPHEITLSSIQDPQTKKTAEKRIQGVVFVKKRGKTLVFDGPEFQEFEKAMHEKHDEVEIITGNAASLGMVTGPVKICTNIESLEKVQEGDILVASMTRPEYVSAMKKAVAIITDEGGVTCHAAIISRELGIPCVIGTKNASKVLKDGWIVQVKANHGEVIVLEKTEQTT